MITQIDMNLHFICSVLVYAIHLQYSEFLCKLIGAFRRSDVPKELVARILFQIRELWRRKPNPARILSIATNLLLSYSWGSDVVLSIHHLVMSIHMDKQLNNKNQCRGIA